MRPFVAALSLCAFAFLAVTSAGATGYAESPEVARRVQQGELPPVADRLPENPLVVDFSGPERRIGRHGGEMRLLMGREKDVRLMVVYGYARLVVYDLNLDLVPDILESVEEEEGRRFTLRMRKGHRWSDGEPFTARDFRYYWEDIANDPELSPFGLPAPLLVESRPPVFEVIDDYTVRYTWHKPNPFFLPALAGTWPEYIYAPFHYLRKYHPRYTDRAKLEAKAKEKGQRSWVSIHVKKFSPYKNENPDLPTLQPWRNSTEKPSTRFEFVRNPYFHRVDPQGRQLPYLDRVIMNIADGKLIPAKTGAGEADLQARNLSFSDYTFLKESEKRTENRVRLWQTTKGSHIALFPNLNVEDPVWRKIVRDVRFRRALSLAINRREINQVIYYGLATEGNNTVHEDSPLFKKRYRKVWTQFDLKSANALLDDMGLNKRDDRGIRLLPDGRPMIIIVETAGEDTEQTDVLELIHDTWLEAGIKLFTKPLQREVFRNRIFAGSTLVSVWGGLENGLPTPDMSPAELAPTTQQHLQWPKWGQFYETGGKVGEPVDLEMAAELMELNRQWLNSGDRGTRAEIWHRMLQIFANQVYSIGLVAAVPQPVVVNQRLRNVPKKGVYNWEPGAHFGIYKPDTFWMESR
ncbi:MAG: ABC transporter substrate-binding protein [Gammaproteobacteria bacterium]|nr:ABC transporter substrate-binding protein [Gammaproteobacteria bacterium]